MASRTPPLVFVLWLAAFAVLHGAVQAEWTADSWSSCGGSQFCPCGTSYCDAQWPGVTCKAADVCVRQAETWWRCQPRSSNCWAKAVATWDVCGGNSGCPYGTPTCDAQWPGTCCRHGDACVRKDASWWRCEPLATAYDSSVCTAFAATWAVCGSKTCCSNPGDTCVFKNPTWSRCEPASATTSSGGGGGSTATTTPAAPPRGSPPPPIVVRGNRIARADTGATVLLRGINWFGFNVARTMVDGLGHGGADVQTDFAAITRQLRLLGYNAVRLPFRYRDLDQTKPKAYTVKCWDMAQEDLRRRLLEPGTWTSRALPAYAAAPPCAPGYCNAYLPAGSTYDRLMYAAQVFVAHGMYVILDYQPMDTEPQAYNTAEFVCKWRQVVGRLVALSNWDSDLKGRVLIDVINEPDSMHMGWEPGNGRRGARELYLSTLDALHQLAPEGLLYLLEGAGQNNFGLNWGNGFVTDAAIIRRYGLSDANPFFRALLDKPYADRVVLSPHVYPPSITKSTFLGDTLWQQCSIAFGYLQTRGYCSSGSSSRCRVFPVVVGETGSHMRDKDDTQWLLDFADFVAARGGARSYNAVPLAGWLWWAYNENSGDTGGIVYNNWKDLDWNKLRFMMTRLGLTPWYRE